MTRHHELDFEHPAFAVATIPELFCSTANRHPERPAQSYKGGVYERSLVEAGAFPAAPPGEYADLSYSDLAAIVRRLAAGLRACGLDAGDRLAIASHTRMEWTQLDLATLTAGGVVSTIYPSSTELRFEYLLSDCEPTGVVVENAELLRRLLAVEDSLDFAFDFIAVIDSLPDGSGMAAAARDRDDILTVGTLYQRGVAAFDAERVDSLAAAIKPDTLASLVYTSGTTGQPQGVRLTHRNLTSNVDQTVRRFGPRPDRTAGPWIDHTTRHLSVLPLAHVFERLAGSFLMIAAGATVAYAASTETLAEDFQLVEPTVITGVPRLYQQLFERFEATASESTVGKPVFGWATRVAEQYHRAKTPSRRLRATHAVADRLVYKQIRAGLGGQLELCISGGDSLSAELCAIFNGMGIRLVEGYGLTEAAPVVSANPPEDLQVGTIGPPLSGLDIRIDADVDTAFTADEEPLDADAVGELLVRGPNVTPGYWNDSRGTDAAFVRLDEETSEDRWLRTGDIVARRPSGYLQFRARRTEVLVLSTGKNVAPAPIEDALEAHSSVDQAVIIGDSRPFVAALVVPTGDRSSSGETIRARAEEAVEGVNASLEPHERIGALRLVDDSLTVENGLLTPTMKPRRPAIAKRYASEIDALYDTN